MKEILNQSQVLEVLKILEQMYPDAQCALDFNSVFQLLVNVVLSAQTTDVRVNQSTGPLFEKYPTVYDLVKIPEEQLQEYIRPIGMYKTKTKNVLNLCSKLISDYHGEVPNDYDGLIKLPGVGRKTANVVLSVGFGQQRIAVDTHVFRTANRIGFVKEKDVLKTELALMEVVPQEKWSAFHHQLIWHGRQICSARKPKCESCSLDSLCLWYSNSHESE